MQTRARLGSRRSDWRRNRHDHPNEACPPLYPFNGASKAGILGEDRVLRETDTGTPQGSCLSPLLSNVALSGLDEYIAHAPGGPAASAYQRAKRRAQGLPTYRLVRYADLCRARHKSA